MSAADAGKYECQVSTQPKMSKTYSLNVVGEQFLMHALLSGPVPLYDEISNDSQSNLHLP